MDSISEVQRKLWGFCNENESQYMQGRKSKQEVICNLNNEVLVYGSEYGKLVRKFWKRRKNGNAAVLPQLFNKKEAAISN